MAGLVPRLSNTWRDFNSMLMLNMQTTDTQKKRTTYLSSGESTIFTGLPRASALTRKRPFEVDHEVEGLGEGDPEGLSETTIGSTDDPQVAISRPWNGRVQRESADRDRYNATKTTSRPRTNMAFKESAHAQKRDSILLFIYLLKSIISTVHYGVVCSPVQSSPVQ